MSSEEILLRKRRGRRNVDIEDVPGEKTTSTEYAFRILVLVSGVAFFCYTSISQHLIQPEKLLQWPYKVGILSGSLFTLVVVGLIVWRHALHKISSFRHWRARMRRPIQALTLSGVVSYLSMSVAFWPVYSIWSFGIFAVLSYVIICALTFV